MKSIHTYIPLLLLAITTGCTSTSDHFEHEKIMGVREQKTLLAKARPYTEFGLSPSFPFGNATLYLGSTLLEPNQSAMKRFEAGGMPIIEIAGESTRKPVTVLLDTAGNASWIQYSCAAKNDLTFLSNNGAAIPYIGSANTEGVNAFAGVVPLLHIDKLTLNNTPFYIRMARGSMKPAVYSSTASQVDAVLGYDNLRQFQYIQFDLGKGTVSFSTSAAYTPNEAVLIGRANLSNVCLDSLAVQGAVSGQPVPIILDFAGDYAFARGDTREPRTKQVELGEVVYLDIPTEVLAAQDMFPRAGRKMLQKYVVTVCPRQGIVYFERPSN